MEVHPVAHGSRLPGGRKLYSLRKRTAEPVFGVLNPVMGFRQLLQLRAKGAA
jgi:hypothetical protein